MPRRDPAFCVALTRCYFCGEGNQIVINRVLAEPVASQVRKMDGKVIDMTPCSKCEDLMRQGIILIVIDETKSIPDWIKERLPNPYRTGQFLVLREEAIKRMFSGEAVEYALKHRFTFIDVTAADACGLLKAAAEPNK